MTDGERQLLLERFGRPVRTVAGDGAPTVPGPAAAPADVLARRAELLAEDRRWLAARKQAREAGS